MIRAVALVALMVTAVWPAAGRAEVVDGNRIVIIDGDTVALPCAVPARGCAEKIRFIDIDAPETFRPTCENERAVGLRAKARVAELLRGATVYVERSGRKDRYGRTLANLTTADGDVGAVLIREGLAVPYRPGKTAKSDRIGHWCSEILAKKNRRLSYSQERSM